MEIQALKVFFTDADVAVLAARHLAGSDAVEDLEVRLTPEGVVLTGKYPATFFTVSFETVWRVSAAGPEIRIMLDTIRVAGLPAKLLRGALMKTVRDRVEGEAGVRVDGETVVINVTEAV